MAPKRLLHYLSLLVFNALLLGLKARSFLFTDNFAGRDLVGAYSLIEAFQFGWTGKWFLGFEMFKFYPPGFFAFTKSLGFLLTDAVAFKIVVMGSLLILPVAIYYCFSSIFETETGLLAGFMGLLLIYFRAPMSLLYQTLQVGLVAQAFALIFLFLFIGSLHKEDSDYGYLAAIFLALAIISHPFIGLVASIYLVFFFLYSDNLKNGVLSLLGYGLTAVWWLPFIEDIWYAQVYTGPSGKIINLPFLFLPFLLLKRSRKVIPLIATGVLLVLVGLVDAVPFQHYRFFIYGQMFLILAAVPGMKELAERTSGKIDLDHVIYVLGLITFLTAILIPVQPHWSSSVSLENVTPENGTMVVETSHSKMFQSYVPIQMIPLKSNTTVVNGLYADSSISSLYLLGLEKSISEKPIPHPIAIEADLDSEQIENRMKYLGIDYALIQSREARDKLEFMEEVSHNDNYTLMRYNPDFNLHRSDILTVSGPRERWKELNRYIFRNNLTTNIVYLHEGKGEIKLEDLENREIIEKAEETDSDLSARIVRESINTEADKEAIFGLKVKLTED